MSRTNLDLFCWYINVKRMKALPMKDLLVIFKGFFFLLWISALVALQSMKFRNIYKIAVKVL